MITAFEYIDDLHLLRRREGGGKLFIVDQEYRVSFKINDLSRVYYVPAGMETDLASIPTIVPKWIAQKVDAHIEAAIVHDHMCIERPWTSRIAAEIFLAAMEKADVGWIKRNAMYQAVLRFGPKWT